MIDFFRFLFVSRSTEILTELNFLLNVYKVYKKGGCQNLQRRNVERPIFQNFKISNIKITKRIIIR